MRAGRAFAPRLLLLAILTLPPAAHAQSLIDFYRGALESNPTLRTRELGVEQAKAQEQLAASRLLPQVVASGNYYWNDYREAGLGARHYEGSRTALQARQALLDLASYFKLQSARSTLAQSEQQHAAARMSLAGDVVDRYLAVLQAGDEIANVAAEKEATESQLKRLRFMRERQLAKLTDLLEVEAYYQGLLTREIEARSAAAVALERLRETSGLAAERVAPLARSTFAAVSGEEQQWVSDAASNNPSLAALQQAIEAAGKLVESGRAEHMPQVALTATKTNSDQGYDNRATPPYNVGTIGVQVTIPLFEGGRVQATVRDASARLGIAREQYEGARREIERDTRTAYLNARASHARIDSTGAEVHALENVVAAQRTSYEMGATTIVDVLIAQRRLYRSRSDQFRARYDFIRDFTALRVRAGRLTDQDLEEMDKWMARER